MYNIQQSKTGHPVSYYQELAVTMVLIPATFILTQRGDKLQEGGPVVIIPLWKHSVKLEAFRLHVPTFGIIPNQTREMKDGSNKCSTFSSKRCPTSPL